MRLLLDTHILVWMTSESKRLSASTRDLLGNPENTPVFSAVSLWELAIKVALRRENFQVDARRVRGALIANDFEELPVRGDHAVAVSDLPLIHTDPFDRLLIAQATVEGITLLTSDRLVARYPGPIRKV
jgi:PIN domain nuclease of toxin-antitoxin system